MLIMPVNAGSFEYFENFRGSGLVLLRNPYIFCDFMGGGGSGPPAPSESAHGLPTTYVLAEKI